MAGLYHALACAALSLGASAAAADRAPSFIGGAGGSLADARLVGAGGEIYAREAGSVWRRRAGGVAVELVAAWGRSPRELLAMGARSPVFRHDGERWTTLPGMRGRATLAARDAPRAGLAIGTRLFVLAAPARWTSLPAAPGQGMPSALWIGAGPRDALILVDGQLHRLAGGRKPWQPVPLAESVVALGGVEPVALGVEGGVYRLARGRPRKLAADAALAGFRPRQLFGAVLEDGAAMARIERDALRPLGPTPAGDLALVLELAAGGWLAATRSGRVFRGEPASPAASPIVWPIVWSEELVDAAVPAPPATPPGSAPFATNPPASR